MALREVYVTKNHAQAPSEDEVAYPCEGSFSLEQAGALPWPLKQGGRIINGFSVEQAGALPLRTSRSGCESEGESSSGCAWLLAVVSTSTTACMGAAINSAGNGGGQPN